MPTAYLLVAEVSSRSGVMCLLPTYWYQRCHHGVVSCAYCLPTGSRGVITEWCHVPTAYLLVAEVSSRSGVMCLLSTYW